jgi:hypothetical protein
LHHSAPIKAPFLTQPFPGVSHAGAFRRRDLRRNDLVWSLGKDYRPAYALVASADKQAIIKINNVGPLKPDRVIDLNEQAMRYFSHGQDFGLIETVKITLLLGDDWSPGPISDKG